VRALGIDPVGDTQSCYRALVDATSRPGTIHRVPSPADRVVVATLADEEIGLSTPDDRLREALAGTGRLHETPRDEARLVHVRGSTGGTVRDVPRGTLKDPSLGATVVYRIEELDERPGNADGTTAVTVSGPGVPGERTFTLSLPAAELRAIADAQGAYPRGIDAVFATEDHIAALPRSVTIDVRSGAETDGLESGEPIDATDGETDANGENTTSTAGAGTNERAT